MQQTLISQSASCVEFPLFYQRTLFHSKWPFFNVVMQLQLEKMLLRCCLG